MDYNPFDIFSSEYEELYNQASNLFKTFTQMMEELATGK